jgi:peroxiredoxin
MSFSNRAARWSRQAAYYLLIIALAAFVANLWMTRNQASGVAPQLEGEQVGGSWMQVDYHQYRKPVVVYFFAEWCPICKVQQPMIRSLSEDYTVLGVAMQSGPAPAVAAYLQENELRFTVLNDPNGSISSLYGVHGVPAAFVVKPGGEVASSVRGYTTELGMRARLWLAQYL